MRVQFQHEALYPSHPAILSQFWASLQCRDITFGQRYLAISLIIAQSAFLCSLFALVDSLMKSFFAVLVPSPPSLDWSSSFVNWVDVGTAVEPGLTVDGSFPSVDWFKNRPLVAKMRSCVEAVAVTGLLQGARPAKLGSAYCAGRQHGDRVALSSMASS